MNTFITIIAVILIIGYVLFNILSEKTITLRDVLLPILAGIYLGYSYFQHADSFSSILVAGGAFIGIVLGLIIAQLIRVWRDEKTGLVHQKGNWLFIGTYVGIIVLRVAIEVVLHKSGFSNGIPALNDAMLATVVGTYIGRAFNIVLRTLALNNWDFNSLMYRGR